MYVDESGDSGTINSPSDFFILSGLIIHELRWFETLNELKAFRRALRGKYGLKLREEIHAIQMISRRPGNLTRIPKYQRLEIIRACLDWIASQPSLSVITVCIDKNQHTNTQTDLFEFAWNALIMRFENTIRHRNFPGPSNPDERGLILPDMTDGNKLTQLLRRMRHFNFIPHSGSAYGTGSRNVQIEYIIEDPWYKDSAESLFHQMVDVIAYSAMQKYAPNSYMRRKGGRNYYDRLQNVLITQASRRHPLGIVEL